MSSIRKKIFLIVFLIPFASSGTAQDAAKTAAKSATTGQNQLAMLLAVVTAVLAFVIWGMGRVLIELGRQVVDKNANGPKVLSVLLLIGFSLLAQTVGAQNAGTTGVTQVTANYGGLSETTFDVFITVIGVEVITILFLAFSIKRMHLELVPEKPKPVAVKSPIASWWKKLDTRLFTRAIPVEKEADVMLDHNYDGIRELDNALPPWWKYGFYFTIVVAFIYLMNFHVLGIGKNPDEEYQAEMQNARIEKEIYDSKNKDKVDENNVQMADAAGVKAGMELFEANCVACHMKGGGGSQNPASVGPNLTDDYWLHKGSINDVFQSITHGYPDKGMQAWSAKFNPKEISLLASYVKSIKGTNPPNAKLPQGDLYADVSKPANADSVNKTKTDTISAKKK